MAILIRKGVVISPPCGWSTHYQEIMDINSTDKKFTEIFTEAKKSGLLYGLTETVKDGWEVSKVRVSTPIGQIGYKYILVHKVNGNISPAVPRVTLLPLPDHVPPQVQITTDTSSTPDIVANSSVDHYLTVKLGLKNPPKWQTISGWIPSDGSTLRHKDYSAHQTITPPTYHLNDNPNYDPFQRS